MYKYIPLKRSVGWADLVVLAGIAALLYGLIGLAYQWTDALDPQVEIDLSPWVLPKYTFFSLARASVAYVLSLLFTLVYGYVAAKSRRSERVMIPLLDILQSIPVLGFLPGLVLGLIALMPRSNFGLELSCILMIFTGQVWNMTFSFYSSLKSVPKDLEEVSAITGLTPFQKLLKVELPFSAIGLAWNSLMSMAGGWFYLTVCESFVLGNRSFRLRGIGSYMAVAIDRGDTRAMVYGVFAMCLMIIFVDFVIWRPVMAWVRKFQMEESPEDDAEMPFVTILLRDSWIIRRVQSLFLRQRRKKTSSRKVEVVPDRKTPQEIFGIQHIRESWARHHPLLMDLLGKIMVPIGIAFFVWGATRVYEMVRTLGPSEWKDIFSSLSWTFLRVLGALVLASLWTIPAGILIGRSPKLTRFFQPIVQVLASFPAPMIYPFAIAAMARLHIGIGFGSMILMLLGVQWYVLFNVIGGATTIARDLRETLVLIGVGRWTRWKTLLLPSIFPALVTGWITAAGGAWNASFVSEYVQFGGTTLVARGIGAKISEATIAGNFPMLAGSLLAIVAAVVGLNRALWRRVYEFSETRFRFER